MNNTNESFYDILGVPETASDDDIRRAYARLVRKNRPDQNPELYKKLNDAKEVLSDPKRRKEYDQLREFGEQVKELTNQAQGVMEEDPQKAIRLLKEACALAPELTMPRLMLAEAFIAAKDFSRAEAQFRRLLEHSPDEAFLHYNLGGCLKMQESVEPAIASLETALRLDPLHHNALLLLADVYIERKEYATAVQRLEQAVLLDGKESLGDIDTLLKLMSVYLFQEDINRVRATIQRIHHLAEDEDEAGFVTAKIYDEAVAMYKAELYLWSYEVMRHAENPRLTDTDLKESIKKAKKQMAIMAQVVECSEDENIPSVIKALLYSLYLDDEEELDQHNVVQTLVAHVENEPDRYIRVLDYLNHHYIELGLENKERFDSIRNIAADAKHNRSRSAGIPSVTSSGSGCAVFLMAILLSMTSLIALLLLKI